MNNPLSRLRHRRPMARASATAALGAALSIALAGGVGVPAGHATPLGLSTSIPRILPTSDAPEHAGNQAQPLSDNGMGSPGLPQLLEQKPVFSQEAGEIRKEFGGLGSHGVEAVQQAYTCEGLVYRIYNRVLQHAQGFEEPAQCYGAFPESLGKSFMGVQFVYPSDLGEMESARLIVLSPGIGVEPGMLDRQARVYASHGYIVAMGYNLHNWTGSQVALAAVAVMEENKKPGSPLYGKVDASRTVLVGHSAGGGSVVTVNNQLDSALRSLGYQFTTAALVAVNQGPGEFGKLADPVTIPGLWIRAEKEDIVPEPYDRLGYDRATGPAWFTVLRDAYHGTYMDMPDKSAYSAVVMAFAEYILDGTDRAKDVFEGENYSLQSDSEFKDSERKNV